MGSLWRASRRRAPHTRGSCEVARASWSSGAALALHCGGESSVIESKQWGDGGSGADAGASGRSGQAGTASCGRCGGSGAGGASSGGHGEASGGQAGGAVSGGASSGKGGSSGTSAGRADGVAGDAGSEGNAAGGRAGEPSGLAGEPSAGAAGEPAPSERGVTIAKVAVYQAVEIPLMVGGVDRQPRSESTAASADAMRCCARLARAEPRLGRGPRQRDPHRGERTRLAHRQAHAGNGAGHLHRRRSREHLRLHPSRERAGPDDERLRGASRGDHGGRAARSLAWERHPLARAADIERRVPRDARAAHRERLHPRHERDDSTALREATSRYSIPPRRST